LPRVDKGELPGRVILVAHAVPVAYSIGTTFKPANRKPLDSVVHWNHW